MAKSVRWIVGVMLLLAVGGCATQNTPSEQTTSVDFSKIDDFIKFQYVSNGLVNYFDSAMTFQNLGSLSFSNGDYSQAEQYYRKAWQCYADVGLESFASDKNFPILLIRLGAFYYSSGDYAKAKSYYLEALHLLNKSALDMQQADYNQLLNNLGGLCYNTCDYAQAEQCYLNLLKSTKAAVGDRHQTYAQVLTLLGNVYLFMGNYTRAELYYQEAAQIFKSVFGDHHQIYASLLHNLGNVYSIKGDYEQSESYYLQAFEIMDFVSGVQSTDYANFVQNIGNLYYNIGDYAQAKSCYQEALQIYKSVFGDRYPQCANLLNNLGVVCACMDNATQAEAYYQEALQIYKLVFGNRHPAYAQSLHNIGMLYADKGDYAQAEPYYSEALEIRRAVLGERHPDYAQSLTALGSLRCKTGDSVQAELCYQEALQIYKSVFGDRHPSYVQVLLNIGVLYADKGDYAQAEPYYTQSMLISRNRFIESTDFMSEREWNNYWTTMQYGFYNTYPCFAYQSYSTNSSIAAFAYDNELFRKGLLLGSSQWVRQSILESRDSALIDQWQTLMAKRQHLQMLHDREPQSPRVAELQQEVEKLEAHLTKTSAVLRQNRERWSVTWDSVRTRLHAQSVAVEFFTAVVNADSVMYCALLLQHDSPYPELIPLCEQHEIASLVDMTDTATINRSMCSGTLRRLIWDKVLARLAPGDSIYFAPAGLLHQLPIEFLPYDNRHTISDMFYMQRLSSTRELTFAHPDRTCTTATLYGGITYAMDSSAMLNESNKYPEIRRQTTRDLDVIDRGSIVALPATRLEVEEIDRLLRENNVQVRLLTATHASEESFKALSGTHQHILHIATHGFYWSDSVAQQADYLAALVRYMTAQNEFQTPTIDPLNRCGLLFAGANTAWSGRGADLPEGVQDGILTAHEISLMDLRDADIVVLSACNTGHGETTGEGVFGLQRAFKQAGVKTIIMSLWKVDDNATQVMMNWFYTYWLSGMTKKAAFDKARNELQKIYPQPYYWAGFVMLD